MRVEHICDIPRHYPSRCEHIVHYPRGSLRTWYAKAVRQQVEYIWRRPVGSPGEGLDAYHTIRLHVAMLRVSMRFAVLASLLAWDCFSSGSHCTLTVIVSKKFMCVLVLAVSIRRCLVCLMVLQLKLPESVRLRGWLGDPSPTAWIRPTDSLSSVITELKSICSVIVEVEPGDEPRFPEGLTLDGSEKVEWIVFTHAKTMTSYVLSL